MGKKEVIRRFVSFRCNRKGSVKKTFALREMMLLSARFFLTYSFRGAPVFWADEDVARRELQQQQQQQQQQQRALRCKERAFVSSPPKEFFQYSFYRSSSPPQSKEVFAFVRKEKLTKSENVRFIFVFPTTLFHQTEAKNEQTTRRG